jgi:hypothetical protein
MSKRQPKLIVITGPDRAANEVLAREVARELTRIYGAGEGIAVSLWSSLVHSRLFANESDAESFMGSLHGATRTLFAFHCLSLALDLAFQNDPAYIAIDGYWFSQAHSDICRGASRSDVFAMASGFEDPHSTFFLGPPLVGVTKQQFFLRSTTSRPLSEPESSDKLQPETPLASRIDGAVWEAIHSAFGPWVRLDINWPVDALVELILQYAVPRKRFTPEDGRKDWLL